jgi:hypothetical protein
MDSKPAGRNTYHDEDRAHRTYDAKMRRKLWARSSDESSA